MGVLRLTIQPGQGGAPSTVSFDDPKVTLGRNSLCDIRLPFQIISSNHLTFSKENGQYKVVDLGSTNGTFLNESQLISNVACPIKSGDVLRIVDLTIRIDVDNQLCEGFTLAESTIMLREMVSTALGPKDGDEGDTAFLEIVSGFGRGKRILLPDRLENAWIGASHDSLLQIHQPGFPARVGEIKRNGDGYAIDLVENCGEVIRVNGGLSLQFQPLSNGDRLYIGNMDIAFFDPLEEHLAALDGHPPAPAAAQADRVEPAGEVAAVVAAAVEEKEPVIQVDAVDDVVAPGNLGAAVNDDAGHAEAPKRKPLGFVELGLIIISSVLMLAGLVLFLYVLEII